MDEQEAELPVRIARVLLEHAVCVACLATKFDVTHLNAVRAIEYIGVSVIVSAAPQCEECGSSVGPIFSLTIGKRGGDNASPAIVAALRGRTLCAPCITHEVEGHCPSPHDVTRHLYLLGRDRAAVREINGCDRCGRVTVVYLLA